MTKGEAIAIALRWIDEATVGGYAADSDEIADYKDRMATLLNNVLQFMASQFPLFAKKSVVRSEYPLYSASFTRKSVMPEDKIEFPIGNVKSFYVEICGRAEIFVDGEMICKCDSDGEFKAYKGNLPLHNGTSVLRIASDVPFSFRDIALYTVGFENDEAVPTYAPFVPYAMPKNFRELDKILFVNGTKCEEWQNYYKYDDRTVLLPYDVFGEFLFLYKRNPELLAAGADEMTVLDCNPTAETLLPLKLAADVTSGMEEKAGLSAYLESKFAAMLQNMVLTESNAKSRIETVYGVG